MSLNSFFGLSARRPLFGSDQAVAGRVSQRLGSARAQVSRAICASALALLASAASPIPALAAATADAPRLAGHELRFDAAGNLLPWIDWNTALDREMRFYETAPLDHGYPVFVTTTFLDGNWKPTERDDTIPATQNAAGILSYLKFYALRGKHNPRTLAIARAMGDYLIEQDLTPASGPYPRFPHSTGRRQHFPQPADSGSQNDRPYEIQPDKGALAGYALLRLYDATGEKKYLDMSRHIADVLAKNQIDGDATHSPWPFRVDTRNGEARGPVSGNLVFALRLYDELVARGDIQFKPKRDALWRWIKQTQIPSAAGNGALFAQFFEDHDNPANRTAWAPLSLARYLLEKRSALDPDWRADAKTLIDFVRRDMTHVEFGVRVCHEQDEDHDAWGGVNSTYGAVLAMYAKATGSSELAREARAALNFAAYAIDEQGRARDLPTHAELGGWQEDAHTDVIHNFVDAIEAYPDWAASMR
ncbi:MAG: hypothetical protein J0I77_02270 [Rudaea sp.]|uniref:hypothetical protein n=1 Tax=Rudaea sp. 3F27F6 TaxID=2502208 RepID=UPI0010FA18B2|nr:hypothetical protein [Rudaea sp. 3F27F6]MBN8884522.1 hypothetical protein [Rudaea sp.]